MLTNPQPTKFDTNGAWINSTTGRPLSSTSPTLIFAIGGPDVDAVTYYYETSTSADRAPITWSSEGSDFVWTLWNGTEVVSVTQASTWVIVSLTKRFGAKPKLLLFSS